MNNLSVIAARLHNTVRLGRIVCGIVLGLMSLEAQAGERDGLTTAVRVGNHPGFGRVVFEMAPGATYELATEGDRLQLVFTGAGSIEQPTVLPHNVSSLRMGAGTATLMIATGARARPLRMGNKLVIDVIDPAAKTSAAPAEVEFAPTRPSSRMAVQPGPKPLLASPISGDMREKQSAPPPVMISPVAAPPVATPPVAPPTPTEPATRNMVVKAQPARAQTEGAAPATAPVIPVHAEDLTPNSVASKGEPAPVTPQPPLQAEPVLLTADIGVGAASFRRGEFALVVLDRRMPLEAPAGLEGATVTQGPVTTLLQVPLSADRALQTKRVPAGWLLEIVSNAGGTVAPRPGPTGVTFPFARPGRAVTVLDPVTGGVLLVGTSLAGGSDAALASGLGTPDFRLLPTWLGVAVEPVADQVDLRAVSSGFLLTGAASSQVRTMADIKGRRFDFPNEAGSALLNRLKAQLTSAAVAPPRGRTRDRMAAAQAYMALGMGVEAQALMQLVATDDPQAVQDAQVPALGAVAAVMAGRLDEAAALDDPRLDGSDEVALWRGLRDRRSVRETPAARGLGGLVPLAMSYPAPLRRLVWPDVAEAAVEAGGVAPGTALPPFAKAMLLEREGKVDEAITAYTALQAGHDRLDQVRGAVKKIELQLASGRIGPGEAADLLERQSFAWRGDAREANIRMRSAELRAAAGSWRQALDSLRNTETLFPEEKAAIRVRKAAAFQSMLTAQGGKLSPLEVVLMAAEYSDCVPEGPQGAGLAALLADKLSSLDLPARAIPVLQGLVKGAPAGPARAEFGLRLGQLLLDGEDAAGTISALQASSAPDLPAPVLENRGLLLAKARVAQGEIASAARGLQELGTAAADDLRATLLAGTGDWRGSLAALSDLAAKVVPAEGSLSIDAQDVLMRQASAAAQAGDATMLKYLERSAARLTGARADLFRVLTVAPLAHTSELPRAAQELKLARVIPQRLQDLGTR